MPTLSGNTLRARLAGSWRAWSDVFVRQSGAWVRPEYVWAFHDGEWRVVWAAVPSPPTAAAATLESDGSVTIDWTAADPDAVDTYQVRRSNETLVATVNRGDTYEVTDAAPLAGVHAYTIVPTIGAVTGVGVATNTVSLAPLPATVTVATYAIDANTTGVEVEWDSSAGAVAYEVKRPDGSLVATVAAPTLAVNDTSPRSGSTPYTVAAVALGGSKLAGRASNSLNLALGVGSLDVDNISPGGAVTLTWDESVAGVFDDVQVTRNGVVIITMIPGGETATDSDALKGSVVGYQVRTRIAGNPGPYGFGVVALIPPDPPAFVTIEPTGVLGELRLNWTDPVGLVSYYEINVSDNGSSWTPIAPIFRPFTYIFTGGSGVRYMRIRSVSGGAVSSWVVRSTTPLWDNTPPAEPTITSWKPEASYGRLVLRFTTAASDNHEYSIDLSTNDGAWTPVVGWTPVGNSQNVALHLVTGSAGVKYEARVNVRDVYGNTRTGTTIPYYTLRAAEQFVIPASSGHWRSGVYGQNTANPGRPYQGYFSDPALDYVGLAYYGTGWRDACDAISSFGGKVTVTSMTVVLSREGGGVNVAQCVNVGSHALTTNPGFVAGARPAVNGVGCIAALAYGGATTATLTATTQQRLRDGNDFGIGIQGQPYMFMHGAGVGFAWFGAVYSLG